MLKNYPVLDLTVFGLENVRTEQRFEIGDELSRLNNGKKCCIMLCYIMMCYTMMCYIMMCYVVI